MLFSIKQILESRKVSFHVWSLDNNTFPQCIQLKSPTKCKSWLDIMIIISDLIHPRRVCWLEKCYVTTLATVTLFTLHWLSNVSSVLISNWRESRISLHDIILIFTEFLNFRDYSYFFLWSSSPLFFCFTHHLAWLYPFQINIILKITVVITGQIVDN